MATLVLSAVGRALGGRVGAAVGGLVGRQLDGLLLAPGARDGARLSDLAVTASSYGVAVPRVLGRMRLGGTIIWATDLKESSHRSGGGKGRPAQTTYSYSASFAVALASSPLARVGRIWADGVLLRGSAGDLKVSGQFRFHDGRAEQPCDPLLAAAEGPGRCPAYRGLAYAVFEDLELADFGNRIPVLSFEVFAPDTDKESDTNTGLDLAALVAAVAPDADAAVPLTGIAGLSVEGSLAEVLDRLAPLVPFSCDVAGERLVLAAPPARFGVLPEAIRTAQSGGHAAAPTRRRSAPSAAPPGALRYYDVDRDYQPGVQRAPGLAGAAQPGTLELPVALTAAAALDLVTAAARRAGWGQQTLTWPTAVIDPQLGPGARVQVPGHAGVWQITDWEWRADGVELTLVRVPAGAPGAAGAATGAADPGRAATAADLRNGPTVLHAFELPWDGSPTTPPGSLWVAAASPAGGWSGAALYLDDGTGSLRPAGNTGRLPAVLGTALDALADGTCLLPDEAAAVTVALLGPDMALAEASGARLANGANRALLGEEIIQFARAAPLGDGRWRLSGLLRGRGGTEAMTGSHVAGERFVLLDERLAVLEASLASPAVRVAAIGLADPEPVLAEIALRGSGLRPLGPVHPRAAPTADGSLLLRWTRRARGAWAWSDGAELPLHEEAESYEVLIGSAASPHAAWQVSEPWLALAGDTVRALRAAHPGAAVLVRQRGSYAVSPATLVTRLS